jgi:toxin-antitoxin system PIN domain toxin
MKYLLDVNTLLAAIIQHHPQHEAANRWLKGKSLALCPISELGFVRITTQPKAYNLAMSIAKEALNDFVAKLKPEFVPADISAAGVNARSSDRVTDTYLADLAARHKMKLATFDTGINHGAVEVIAT